ncbi:MAG TPA: hypothetical protein VHS09_04610, partial [Polyangiaceae bacterium]|nr:hypothetical protein [Polyangiaceae bacterium]
MKKRVSSACGPASEGPVSAVDTLAEAELDADAGGGADAGFVVLAAGGGAVVPGVAVVSGGGG